MQTLKAPLTIPSVGKAVACTACMVIFVVLFAWLACTLLIPDVIGVQALDFTDPSSFLFHGAFFLCVAAITLLVVRA